MSELRYSRQLAVKFDPDTAEAINRAAAAKRVKTSELLRRITVDYLEANGNPEARDLVSVGA